MLSLSLAENFIIFGNQLVIEAVYKFLKQIDRFLIKKS